jgi:ribosomal protein L7/L12
VLKFLILAVVFLAVLVLLARIFGRRPIEPVGQQRSKMITMDGGAVTAEIDGQELDIDPAALTEIRRLADNGQKIEAIKLLRDATGLGLAEAKEIVESLDRMRPKES